MYFCSHKCVNVKQSTLQDAWTIDLSAFPGHLALERNPQSQT